MSDESNKPPTHPLVGVAASCVGSSVGIAALAFLFLYNITDSGMWAIAFMVAAPSLLGCVIAFFMTTRQP
jgi:hypothetical protein